MGRLRIAVNGGMKRSLNTIQALGLAEFKFKEEPKKFMFCYLKKQFSNELHEEIKENLIICSK